MKSIQLIMGGLVYVAAYYNDDYNSDAASNYNSSCFLVNQGTNTLISIPSGNCAPNAYCNEVLAPGDSLSVGLYSGEMLAFKSCFLSNVFQKTITNISDGVEEKYYFHECAVSTLHSFQVGFDSSGNLWSQPLIGMGTLQINTSSNGRSTDIIFSLGNCWLSPAIRYPDGASRTLFVGGFERDNPVLPDNCFMRDSMAQGVNKLELPIALNSKPFLYTTA